MEETQKQKPIKKRRLPIEKYVPRKKREDPEVPPTRVNGEQYKPDNPYKANKYVKDPRQEVCWNNFIKRWAKGDINAKAAALDAGYSDTSSANISQAPWFKERFAKLRRRDMLSKAERNLDKVLDLSYTSIKEKDGVEVEEVNTDILKVVVDVSKIVAQTLGKDEGYSTKSTIDNKVQGEIQIKAINYSDQVLEAPRIVEVIEAKGEEMNEDNQDYGETV